MFKILILLLSLGASDKEVLVLFTADNCQYCELIKKDLRGDCLPLIKDRFGSYYVINVSRFENRELQRHYQISSVPTLIIFDLGYRPTKWPTVKDKMVGYNPSDKYKLLEFLRKKYGH